MPTSIRPVRVNHLNVVLEDVSASVAHFKDLYAAEFLVDLPQTELHAYLFELGQVIFEAFVPHEFLPVARYGPHYVGIEYQADMDEVRAAVAERGIRIVRDIGIALHTHPADCFGVAFEFYDDYFHDRKWDELGGRTIASADFWRDEHPLGLTGLKAYTVAVDDMASAKSFLEGFLSAEPVYEEPREALSARAVGLQVADAVVELQTPAGEGALSDHLRRYGDGIRAAVFGVRSVDQTRRYFRDRGVEIVAGGSPGAIAVPALANQGVIFEFAE